MKFKIKFGKDDGKNHVPIDCLDWKVNDELYSVGDNNLLYKWNLKTCESIEIAKLPDDFTPSDLHWLIGKGSGVSISGSGGSGSSINIGTVNAKGNDSLLIASRGGRFIILNRNESVEKNISAHVPAAITSCRWSPDGGSSLLTSSEDGTIKIWSRSGMLRSIVIQGEDKIRTAQWSPDGNSIIYCQSTNIAIKPLEANSKLLKWKAHDGMVLSLTWSNNSEFIASAGEDCRYKVWDCHGTHIYTSIMHENAFTSIEYSPNGQLLAVGGFNTLMLCNFSGSIYNDTKFSRQSIGSIYRMCWSQDSTQIAVGTSLGKILFAYVVEQERICGKVKAKTIGRKTIEFQNILMSDTKDLLEFPGRITNWQLGGYGHLIVSTATQVYIYNEKYLNTPAAIIDGRHDVRLLILGPTFFLIVDQNSIWVYTYTGRLHSKPTSKGLHTQLSLITEKTITIGQQKVILRDSIDRKVLYSFDLISNEVMKLQTYAITEIIICRLSGVRNKMDEHYLALIDQNANLFICTIRNNSADCQLYKIGSQVTAIMWSTTANILCGLHDSYYSVWYCPGESAADPTLTALTTSTGDTSEFGKNVTLENFEGPIISFKCTGILYTIQINVYCEIVHRLINNDRWMPALKLCRYAQDRVVWAILAAIASKENQLVISEEAYSASLQIDKVHYLQHIKNLPNGSAEQLAENSLIMGRIKEAETILVNNKKITEAIQLSMRMHHWERALTIATTHGIDLNVVLDERKKYLKALGKAEIIDMFLKTISSTIK